MKFIQPTCRCCSTRGFTLIELLVVVLIIGILAAIALPQYQKAVLKSRYSGLMPIAAAVANGQEIHYMEKGNYTSDITKLDIIAPRGGVNANIEVSDGTDQRFEYVLAFKDDLPGLAYVVYQKHSPQFANTVMCEANDELNSKATWLCKDALKGTKVESGSLIGDGWTAYILKGTEGSSTFAEPSKCTGEAPDDIEAPNGVVGHAVCNEETGNYQYQWPSTGQRIINPGPPSFGESPYQYAGDYFAGYDRCYPYVANGCGGATFKDGAYCNGQAERGCAGAIFREGGHCGYENGGHPYSHGECEGAIIQDGGYCIGYSGMGCDQAEYSGSGCCSTLFGDYCGDKPKCP